MSVRPADYKMSFGTGGLFVNESIAVVRLHIHGEPWSATLQRSIDLGATSLPKAASNRRVLREIVNRVSCLADVERLFLVDEADRPEQEALLWIATCRCYTFIEEFTVEVIQDRFLSLRLDLPIESFDHFFDSKAEEDA